MLSGVPATHTAGLTMNYLVSECVCVLVVVSMLKLVFGLKTLFFCVLRLCQFIILIRCTTETDWRKPEAEKCSLKEVFKNGFFSSSESLGESVRNQA